MHSGIRNGCPNVQEIIHWGPVNDLESYVQETGRGGRDRNICSAAILFQKSDQQHTAKSMMQFCLTVAD